MIPEPEIVLTAQQRLQTTVDEMIERGITRVHVVAWRDLDDDDAGGSEVHADEFMRRWAAAGLEVTHRTSTAVGQPASVVRNGYLVDRSGSRYSVFAKSMIDEMRGRMGPSDAFVEIWNGVPWLSPVWYRRPSITIVHHVHGPMWDQIFPRPFSSLGRLLETRIAPPFYRKASIVTPSEATRAELLDLGFSPHRVTAINNGVDPKFHVGGTKTPQPSLVAVGRLAPVKRFEALIAQALITKSRVPDLTLTIIGDGPERERLVEQITDHAAGDWITLAGRVPDDELVISYQRAWLTVSASLAEGWGLSLTEGAACGTPSVATDISGHRSSVIDGVSGELVPLEQLGERIADVLLDPARLARLRDGALSWAAELSWDRSAADIAAVLLDRIRADQGG